MSISEINQYRKPRTVKLLPESVDMGMPLDINGTISDDIYNKIIDMSENTEDCFGKMFDIKQNDCAGCADNEVCGIMFGNAVRAKVKELDIINSYLDLADFSLIDLELLDIWAGQKDRTVEELYNKVSADAKCTDEVAIVEWIKRWIRDGKFCTREGIIYKKN